MRYKLFFLNLIIVSILSGCEDNQVDNVKKLEKVEKYEDGRTKSELWNFDTIKVYIEYNEEGMLIDSIPYNQDALIHGTRKAYQNDEGNEVYSYINYVNNVGQGKITAYYVSGELHGKGQINEDKRIKDWFYYYKNGNLLSYKYYDYYGRLVFYRMYAVDGKLEKSKGDGIGYFEFKSDTVKVGEKFTCRVNVATPPDCKIKVFVAEKVTKNNDPVQEEFYEYELENGSYVYSTTFNKVGTYKKGFGWLLTDTINDIENTDFKVQTIIVR